MFTLGNIWDLTLLESILYVIPYQTEIQFGYNMLELFQRLFSRALIML